MINVTAKLVQLEEKKLGIDSNPHKGIMDFVFDYFGNDHKSNKINLKKGYDIKLTGGIESKVVENKFTTTVALKPQQYVGISPIPKVEVETGQNVLAGDVIFYDKKKPGVLYTSPVSGEIIEIRRGDKRSITEIVILADKEQNYKQFEVPSDIAFREELVKFLLDTGAWTMINERPYDVVPDIDSIPQNIFISTFDTAPLAPDNNIFVNGNETAFQKGVDVLAKLTEGNVILGVKGDDNQSPAFTQAKNCVVKYINGVHPAGNVGVQIHHIAPIKGHNKVWTMNVQQVIALGNLFITGKFVRNQIIAITGNELVKPQYLLTYQGASVKELLEGKFINSNVRFISGDVLSGKQIALDGYLNPDDDQLSVISEGDQYEMFGWLLPLSPRPSISGTFPNGLIPDYKFNANTNTHGEKRAFVVTGQYEEVLPMNIYPQHLFKAILEKDVERMEGLGIHELTEEDVALCEFVCTSKQPLQSLLREGLDYMRTEA